MMRNYYQIAGIYLLYFGEMIFEKWRCFTSSSCKSDLTIYTILNRTSEISLESYEPNVVSAYVVRLYGEVALCSKEWNIIEILSFQDAYAVDNLLCHVFYTHAVKRHMIQVHSSLIDYQGRGIMFLGPSGIGKTTQAERWNEYRGAVIINGDMVFVQETEDQFLGWGTPWHGSSPYCENASVPLEALVILKQSRENRIRRLEGFEMVAEVSNSVFYPTYRY